MFKSIFRIILRHLWRNKVYTLINIIGLGAGIAAMVWAIQDYRFAFSFDGFHKNRATIYRALIKVDGSDDIKGVCPLPLAIAAKNDFSVVQEAARWEGRPLNIKAGGNEAFACRANFTDAAFFTIFNFPLVRGAIRLDDPSTVLITEKAATKFFGSTDPVGKTLLFYSDQPYRKPLIVTGVLKDPPANSSLQFETVTHISNRLKPDGGPVKNEDWGWLSSAVFLRLTDAGAAGKLQEECKKYIPLEQAARQDIKVTSILLEPLATVAGWSGIIDKNDLQERPNDPAVYGPLVLAIFILLSACLNFANTSVAQSNRRLKEIGVRKVMGSSKRQIMLQQLLECACVVVPAIGLSMVFNIFWLRAWNSMFYQMPLVTDYLHDHTLQFLLLVILPAVTLLAGAYPALYISRFKTSNIFRGSVRFGGRNLFPRLLLGLQIVISFMTVIVAMAFARNASFQRHYDYGYAKADIMGVRLQKESIYPAVRDELNKIPGVEAISGSRDQIGFSYHTFPLAAHGQKRECTYLEVGDNYTDVMKLRLVAGRYFFPTGKGEYESSMLVNEKLAFAFGWKPSEAVGQQVRKDEKTVCTVVGVLKDFTQNTLFEPIQPLAVCLIGPEQCSQLIIHAKPGQVTGVYEKARAVWGRLYPLTPFTGYYQDEVATFTTLSNKYVTRIFSLFAIISVLLTVTGMSALVSLTVLKRMKEIAIRKVVGANGRDIFRLILRGYYRIFLLSAVLGCYVGYSFSRLLMDMIFRINNGVDLYSLVQSFLCVLLASGLTVSIRVWQVIRTGPMEVLNAG